MRKTSIIPKENAVFWLDKNGFWHNEHGKFEHKRVIDYFHASIRKDEDGYHVYQATDELEEKVYFPYEDTALFIFDLILGEQITVVLNTKKRIVLEPRHLFIREDNLYLTLGDEIAKFTTPCLLKLSKALSDEGERVFIETPQGRHEIKRQ